MQTTAVQRSGDTANKLAECISQSHESKESKILRVKPIKIFHAFFVVQKDLILFS